MLFIKTGDGYKIADWYTDSTFSYDQINRGTAISMNDPDIWFKSSSASILSNCEEYQDCLEASLQSTAALVADVNENSVARAATSVDFNRSAMATYALNNCSKTNPSRGSSQVPEYKDFSTVSSTSWDCTNFISHVMLSGGAPVYNNGVNQSTTGWYYVNLNNRSSSWSSVEQFNTYVTNNYINHNKGPAALSSVYYSNIEFSPYSYNSSLGNVIQINYGGATFGHSTVITGFIQNAGGTYNACITSRTAPGNYNYNRSLSAAYPGNTYRLISLISYYN